MVLGSFIYAIASAAGNLLTLLLVVSAVLSFFPLPPRSSPLYGLSRLLYQVTEPVLRPIRRWLPDFGGMDLSPLVAMAGIWVVLLILRSLLVF